MQRHLRAIGGTAVALLALAAGTSPALAATPGTFSIGGNFGTGIYSNSDLNDSLEVYGFEEVSSGWELGGSLRYQISPKVALDLEANSLNPKSSTEIPGEDELELSTPALAVPLNLYVTLSENDQYRFNVFAGAGVLSGVKVKREGGGFIESESETASSFYGQGGLEAQMMVSPQFALTARALGRLAKATIEEDDDEFDVDLSGVAFGLGARIAFGDTGE